MARIARRLLEFREGRGRGKVMRPSTFSAIERRAARGGYRDPKAVAGAAYWRTLAAKARGNPISEVPDPEHPGEMRFADWRIEMLRFISSHWYGGTLSDRESEKIMWIALAPPGVYDWSFIRDADDDLVREIYYYVKDRHPEPGPHRGFNPSLLDAIRHGDKVTILMPAGMGREGQEYEERTGTAVMRGPGGWVLNLGGRFGTPAVANERNIVRVRQVNPKKSTPRKGESPAKFHERRVREMVAKMPKPVREVFDRNPATYKFVFRNPVDEAELERAADLYETFHGKEPSEILEIEESAIERGEFVVLGDLIELTFLSTAGDEVQIKFASDGVRVASSPQGTSLYLKGGNQDISSSLGLFKADTSKDVIDLGELKQIVYDAAKWQTDFTPQEWEHKLGEETGVRPRAFFDQLKKRIFFAGGEYRVERAGIVN